MLKTGLALGVVLATGLAALAWATDDFTVVTAEAARRRAVLRAPLLLPALRLHDQSGAVLISPQDLASDGRVSIVTFGYTRCRSICSVLNAQTRQLQQALLARGLSSRVRLLTISFDPARDTLDVLREHAKVLGADLSVWRIARPDSEAELQSTLRQFGVVTVRDDDGEFQHNAAWHIVDADGRLARIVDVDEPALALDTALRLAGAERR